MVTNHVHTLSRATGIMGVHEYQISKPYEVDRCLQELLKRDTEDYKVPRMYIQLRRYKRIHCASIFQTESDLKH
jgi:hypothetical protein